MSSGTHLVLPPSEQRGAAGEPRARALTGGELDLLRGVLLGPAQQELAQLRQRLESLEQQDQQVRRLAEQLPQAFALRQPQDPAVKNALIPVIGEALCDALAKHPALLTSAFTSAIASWLRRPFTMLARLVVGNVPRFKNADGTLLDMLLIHRSSHTLIERQTLRRDEDLQQVVATMLESLQQHLHEEIALAHYSKLECIRVENLTFGIHAGPLAILLSVIDGRNPHKTLAHCRRLLATIHATHALALGDFDPEKGPGDQSLFDCSPAPVHHPIL